MERSLRELHHGNTKISFYSKKNHVYLSVSTVMFCKQFLASVKFTFLDTANYCAAIFLLYCCSCGLLPATPACNKPVSIVSNLSLNFYQAFQL